MSRAPRVAAFDHGHVAFARGAGGVRLGLRALGDADWLECACGDAVGTGGAADTPDTPVESGVAVKRELLREQRADVFRELDGSEAAQLELEQEVTELCAAASLPSPAARPATPPDDPSPIVRAGLRVRDDLCILQPRDGRHVLTAAFVCAPSYWRLADKIGRPLAAIHAPVPELEAKIGKAVERTIASLAAGRPLVRLGWGIGASPVLFRPGRDDDETAAVAGIEREWAGAADDARRVETLARVGRTLHVRTERQSLRRLERSGAVVFSIRVYADRLDAVAADASRAAELHGALAGLTAAETDYKGLTRLRAPLLAYLAAAAAEALPRSTASPSRSSPPADTNPGPDA